MGSAVSIFILSSRLLEALVWLYEHGYYDSYQSYQHDRVRVDIHRENFGDEKMTSVSFDKLHTAISPEDMILFKLTFGGK